MWKTAFYNYLFYCLNIQGYSDWSILSVFNGQDIRTMSETSLIVWKSVCSREEPPVKCLTDLYIPGQCQIYSFFGNPKMEKVGPSYLNFNLKEVVCGFVPFSAHQHSATLQDRGKVQKHTEKIKGDWEQKR